MGERDTGSVRMAAVDADRDGRREVRGGTGYEKKAA